MLEHGRLLRVILESGVEKKNAKTPQNKKM